ncbi:MAG: rod shape-determining protein MreD [Rhodothermaceae bacterium]|nr:rod shape-determining protein MreD [Rhodothermaceae bacterium]MXX59351.1 rod shape-determining protein MreD [Rhodothermaceae bacterium]MYD18884.1 rod shape-determining protein MreD [Rhodothermaceae bacterium]MYD55923.1 rod shape-determining protein MreD [Rhodothermaceae bacterium]MYJ57213.1 rod shape-determining protein MreD [Rhodothermaceae bacterium]
MSRVLNLIFAGAVVVLLQWLFFGRLEIWGAYPDVALLFLIWLAVRHGRVYGAVGGFLVGFALDAIYGLWGIQMFVKTLMGFLVGFVANIRSEVMEKLILRAVEATFVTTLVHNAILVLFVMLQSGTGRGSLVWAICVGGTLYTTFVAFLLSVFRSR